MIEPQVRVNMQSSVKQHLIESRFTDEPLSYEQAVVTYHHLQNQKATDDVGDNDNGR